MNWARTVERLNRAVVRSLGEDLLLEQNGESASIRGLLTDPERAGRVAGADFVMAEAMLSIRATHAPQWLARGTTVTRANSKAYQVIRVMDNGEGMLEVTLCPSS